MNIMEILFPNLVNENLGKMNSNFILTIFSLVSFISCSSAIQNALISLPMEEENIINSFYKLENILKLDLDPSDKSAVSDFVNMTFQSQIQKYLDENSECFLNNVVNSGIVFHIFLLEIDRKFNYLEKSIKSIRRACCIPRSTQKKMSEKDSLILEELDNFLIDVFEYSKDFVEHRVCLLLHEPPAKWNQTKKIIGLYIKYLQNIKSFLYSFEGGRVWATSTSFLIARYEFIIEKFSNFIESDTHIHELKKLSNELKTLQQEGFQRNPPKFTDPLNIVALKRLLFSLFSSYILSLNNLKLEDWQGLDTKLLCSSIIAASRFENSCYYLFETEAIILKGDTYFNIENSKKTETELINSVFDTVCRDVKQNFLAGPYNNPKIRELHLFKGKISSHDTFINLLRNLVEGAFDLDFEETTKMSKLKVQTCLHLNNLRTKLDKKIYFDRKIVNEYIGR
jgi:hypothetical protein